MEGFRVVKTSVKDFIEEERNVIISGEATNETFYGDDFNVLRGTLREPLTNKSH